MPVTRVVFERQVVDSLLTYSRMAHPREGILLLRGRARKGVVEVTGVMIPPGAVHARSYSSFSWFMIPIDMSYLGVAHSHPSGNASPSHEDMLNATGRIMVIIGYPYDSERCLGVFDREGRQVPFDVR